MKIPTETIIKNFPLSTVIVRFDKREQHPWDLKPMATVKTTLQTGDYSSYCGRFVLERKNSVDELISCMTKDRERFERELERMQAFEAAVVLVEGSYGDLVSGNYRSQMNKSAALGSLVAWQLRYRIPFFFAENRSNAEEFAKSFFRIQQRDRLLELHRYLPFLQQQEKNLPKTE